MQVAVRTPFSSASGGNGAVTSPPAQYGGASTLNQLSSPSPASTPQRGHSFGTPRSNSRSSSPRLGTGGDSKEISDSEYYAHLSSYVMVPHMDSHYDDYKWLPVSAVVTFDGSLLLYEYFGSDDLRKPGDPECSSDVDVDGIGGDGGDGGGTQRNSSYATQKSRWYNSNSLMRINLRQSSVEPLLTLGLDTFTIKHSKGIGVGSGGVGVGGGGSGGSGSGSGGSGLVSVAAPSSLGSKEVPPVAFLSEHTEDARKWIHVCAHPSSDSELERPGC